MTIKFRIFRNDSGGSGKFYWITPPIAKLYNEQGDITPIKNPVVVTTGFLALAFKMLSAQPHCLLLVHLPPVDHSLTAG